MWPDERIDDAIDRIEKRSDRLERSIDDLRTEVATLRRDMFNAFVVVIGLIVASWGTLVAHAV